jgi:hypothetical protein
MTQEIFIPPGQDFESFFNDFEADESDNFGMDELDNDEGGATAPDKEWYPKLNPVMKELCSVSSGNGSMEERNEILAILEEFTMRMKKRVYDKDQLKSTTSRPRNEGSRKRKVSTQLQSEQSKKSHGNKHGFL